MDIARILCPTDFSEASTHAVDLAVTMASRYKARIAAVHVVDAGVVVPEFGLSTVASIDEAGLSALRRKTEAELSAASRAGISIDVFVDVGSPAARILDRAAMLPADLIVMGTHGRTGLGRLLMGSVAEKVVRSATYPVLTVKTPLAETSSG